MNALLLATILINPLAMERWQQMLMLLPLCLGVSIVYKTLKCDDLKTVPAAVVQNWITIVVGMYLVGAGLYIAYAVAIRLA
jgi:hypothetical protein